MKLEQQLRQLSFSGLAAALLLMVVPNRRLRCISWEGFLPPVWALAWWLLFLPCLWYGLVRLRRIVQEDNHQKVLLALCGAFIFCPVRAQNSVGNGELFTSDRRWSGGYLVRARGGGDSRRGCAVVSGAIAGARRPDDAWRKWNVDGGDWSGCRLSGVENGLPRRATPRCRRFFCAQCWRIWRPIL
ncbi:cobalamin biosynthesis protein [Salmonella enterica subsp. arizonae]|uniref:Cobalamin biosynthesis protein n=1 Tax=Salmonella enterica subsp. arizonae TaxID=59203 RepID=A0A379TCC2_SALER|nr:cobalamin biosynthesis protein [Salmonella enterica subsp. arizonae]